MDTRLAGDAPPAARWVRAARNRRRISQRDLAEIAGVPRSTIERIEAGRTTPRIDTLESLLHATGFEFVIRDRHGKGLEIDEEREALIDRGGRRFPAHLRSERVLGYFESPKPGYPYWWGWHNIAWPGGDDWVPEYTHWRRRHPPQLVSPETARFYLGHIWEDAT